MDKALLRKEIVSRLKTFDGRDKESALIVERLLELDEYRNAGIVLAYAPMATEVDISPLFCDKRLLFPYIDGNEMFFAPPPLVKGRHGFMEPRQRHAVHFDRAVALVPARALTKDGYRLGRGGGYYDRFLEKNKAGLFSIGLAFSIQIFDKLPVEEHDIRLDMVITGGR